MIAIFTYEFGKASENFENEKCTLNTLSNYSVLIETAVTTGYISQSEMNTLKRWRRDPSVWGKN
jgi:orotate phosphoribosyltransferase